MVLMFIEDIGVLDSLRSNSLESFLTRCCVDLINDTVTSRHPGMQLSLFFPHLRRLFETS
jgi:hypothetical protein